MGYDIVLRNKSGKQGRQVTATIDSTMFGNIARFVNHRCHDPSMHVVVDTGTLYPTSLALPLIKFFSKRDIRPGEALAHCVATSSGSGPWLRQTPPAQAVKLDC